METPIVKKASKDVSPTGQLRPDRKPLKDTGLEKARKLVKEILDQVTLHDCPPMNEAVVSSNQIQNSSSSANKKDRKFSSNSSSSVANSTLTSTTASNSQTSVHGSGVPRPFSRQRHVLPTILSPTGSIISTHSKEDSAKQNMSSLHIDAQRFTNNNSEPSPTPADLGDTYFFNTLHSPSFANSHIVSSFSEGTEIHENDRNNEQINNDYVTDSSPPTQVSITNGGGSSISTSSGLPPPPPIQNPLMNKYQPGHGAEVAMGNLSLAALCVRTLDSISNFDIDIPNQLIAAREKDVSDSIKDAENKDDTTSAWQREVEMDPSMVTSENGIGNETDLQMYEVESELDENADVGDIGPLTRREFLSSMDEDDNVLFPDARDSGSDIDEMTAGDSLNTSQDDSENSNKMQNELDEQIKHASEDGMYLSAVEEEEEDEEENESGETKYNSFGINDALQTSMPVFEPSLKAATAAEGKVTMNTFQLSSPPSAQSSSPESKLTISPEQSLPQPRIQMFGSEYARHLSSQSPFSPMVPKMKSTRSRKARKSTAISSSAAASLIGSVSPTSQAGISVVSSQVSQVSRVSQVAGPSVTGGFSVSTMSSASMGSSGSRSIMLEDATEDILSAAITDIVVTHGKEKPPKGYYRISHTSDGTQMDTLKQMSTGGKSVLGRRKLSSVHLNVKKEPKWDRAVQRPCVTALTVIYPDRNEFVPPGFCVVRKHQPLMGLNLDKRGNEKNKSIEKNETASKDKEGESLSSAEPANLNFGTPGERVYLCYRRSREGNPITGLIPLQPTANEAIPEGYTVLERSPRNYIADINSKAGPPVFLAFRQRLANLETLRPLPLVLSVHVAQTFQKNQTPKGRSKKKKGRRLQSYYCTGGTVVPAEVGRFHIMDRSTHPLISPSSVSNRLTLIEASRIKRSSSTTEASHITDTPLMNVATGLANGSEQIFGYTPGSESSLQSKSFCPSDNGSVSSDTPAAKESIVHGILNLVNRNSPTKNETEEAANKTLASGLMVEESSFYDEFDDAYSIASSARSSIFVSRDDVNLQACFDTMDFIPRIEAPGRALLNQIDEETINMLLQARIAVITPILTACYTQHGCSAMLAVEGLLKLLRETDFFLQDVAGYEDPQCSERLTLLDLSVQVVCDMASCTARETNFLPCIEFVSEAIYYAEGNLSARTIGYAIRFYLFVFYFGASVPTSSCWPRNTTSTVSRKSSLDEANDIPLLSEDELEKKQKGHRRGYVPGGAPQAGALALKELTSIFLGRFRKMSSVVKGNLSNLGLTTGGIEGIMHQYVSSIVDGATHQVDVANYTQLALHQIHRSGGSELFWHDMLTSCGAGLFNSDTTSIKAVKDFFITSFSILASLVKVASGKVRKLSNSIEPVPRDVASKLLSVELIHHFLNQWGRSLKSVEAKISKAQKKSKQTKSNGINEIQSIATMAYNIRRLVVPCLLSNTKPGLEDIKVFRRMMRVVTDIWCNSHIRRHMKIEIGVLIEHFVLKFLRLGPQVLPPKRLSNTSSSFLNDLPVALLPQQVCVVNEVKTWFQSEPRDILELFLNFDQVDAHSSKKKFHLLPSTHWKITQQLCGALCSLAEQCTDIVSEQIRLTRIDLAGVETQSVSSNNSIQPHSEEDLREMTHVREGARFLQEKCFDAIGQITRSFMLCAAASSGANYDLLSKLREKQKKDELIKAQIDHGKENKAISNEDNQSESSMESDGNMTIKSVSTIGNIVGGILNKKKDGKIIDTIEVPESPRQNRLIPPSSNEKDGDIVEYWQTSIAAERRKISTNNGTSTDTKKPPRVKRVGPRNQTGMTTPPRPRQLTASSPLHTGRSPKPADDVSVLSMADDSLRGDPHFSQKMEETLNVAFEIMRDKSLKKAFDYLTACNFLTPSPKDIASFLRLYQSRIDTATLGEFLGEGGKDGDETEHFNLIRFHYVSAISFVGMNVEQGLRHFLTSCGFRLPGEAQKIDRIMTTFSQCYWEDNAGDHGRCPFHDEDTVFLIAFAIIMLNTDLHKTSMFAAPPGQSAPKQKQRKKMTKPEFLNNLRGVDNSEDLSKDYLSTIYDSIAANPIAIYRSNENTTLQEGTSAKKTIKFSSNEYGHIIQGNTDLAGMLKHLNKNVKLCQELLRGLASHEHPYLTLRNRKNLKKSRKHMVPEDLVRSAFCSTWHHFHGTINSALDSAHLDPKGLENCLDVLMYSLCATICLDLTVERNAFASQLVRVKYFRENRGLEEEQAKPVHRRKVSRVRDHLDYKNDSWYMRIEKAAESYHENAKVAALDEVDTMFKKLHASLKVDSTLKKEMIRVARKISNGQILLNDPTRYFLKEGEMAKRCNRTGRNVKYTFFLFSDVLIYAHRNGGMYKIHGELPLHLMKIMNLSNGSNDKKSKHARSFHLIHPRKSFVVFASSPEEKALWLDTINTAIGREVKRKARIEGARQASAAFDR